MKDPVTPSLEDKNAVLNGYHQVLSKQWCVSSSIPSKIAKQVLRWYAAHVTGLVKVGRWCRAVSFSFPSVALDEDAGNDDEEDGK